MNNKKETKTEKLSELMLVNLDNVRDFTFVIFITFFLTLLKNMFANDFNFEPDSDFVFDLMLFSIPIALFLNRDISDEQIKNILGKSRKSIASFICTLCICIGLLCAFCCTVLHAHFCIIQIIFSLLIVPLSISIFSMILQLMIYCKKD